jgi:hypothetical protein
MLSLSTRAMPFLPPRETTRENVPTEVVPCTAWLEIISNWGGSVLSGGVTSGCRSI